ncbi:MAG TPA: hypothetical protein VNF91_02475 [Candidatus Acidoferrum sp.]|nr:hypothetical protein [Candidatus Acidoferrum sp.]
MYSVQQRNLFFSAIDNPVLWNASAVVSSVTVTNLSKTNPAQCTVAAADIGLFTNGMLVYITGASGTGTTLANGLHTISGVGTPANTFKLNGVNASTATAAQTDGYVKAAPAIAVTSLSNTNPAVCTVAPADIGKFASGMTVAVIGAVGPGLNDLANANGEHVIANVTGNTFTLTDVNTSGGAAPQTTGVAVTLVSDISRTGQGFINLSSQDADSEELTSLEVYYDKLAIFSSEATQLWGIAADPLQNALDQILRASGTPAPLSTQQYGSGDVLYLSTSGIRSVRARDSSNAAAVSDIGSPIDSLLQGLYASQGESYFAKGIALLEPVVGRFWMILSNEIYVLSAFPGPKITAWSKYLLPFVVDYAVVCGNRIFLRSGDDLYVYGGNDGQQYDACGVEVRLPFLDMGKPATNKIFQSLDATVQGTWTVKNTFDYDNPDTNEETLGVFSSPTWRAGKAAFEGASTHFSLRFYNTDANAALLSNAAIHYALADEEAA